MSEGRLDEKGEGIKQKKSQPKHTDKVRDTWQHGDDGREGLG